MTSERRLILMQQYLALSQMVAMNQLGATIYPRTPHQYQEQQIFICQKAGEEMWSIAVELWPSAKKENSDG
jgi:hypothetical protein